MRKKKLIYVGFAFSHHQNTHSGYHQIQKYICYDKIIDAQKEYDFTFFKILTYPKLFIWLYRKLFGFRLWFTELKCIFRVLFFRDQIFHIIYGENIIKRIHKFKGKTNQIVCTLHQPASFFEKNKSWINCIKKMDKVILVSSQDLTFFTKKNEQVKYIPHGIDVHYYMPGNIEKSISILMVGNWLRDFRFANQIFTQLLEMYHDLDITVVTNVNNFSNFDIYNHLHLKSGISDHELRTLYQQAAVVFFPLIEFTANNAMLEAASCGTDIVVATNNRNDSYFNEELITFTELNEKEAMLVLKEKLNNSANRNDIREYVVENYSWEKIAEITLDFLIEDL